MTESRRSENPTKPMRRAVAALAAGAVILVTACGGGGGDNGGGATGRSSTSAAEGADAQAYVDAGVTSLTADPQFTLDQQTATCISTALVDLIGADALARSGVSPQQFAEAESYDLLAVDIPDDAPTRLSAALDACNMVGAVTSAFVGELGVELPPEAVACIDQRVDRQAVSDAMANGLVGPSGEALQGREADVQATIERTLIDAVVACPPVVTAVFLAEAPGTLTPEAEACVSSVVGANPDRVRAAFGGDSAAAEALGTEIGTACAATLGA